MKKTNLILTGALAIALIFSFILVGCGGVDEKVILPPGYENPTPPPAQEIINKTTGAPDVTAAAYSDANGNSIGFKIRWYPVIETQYYDVWRSADGVNGTYELVESSDPFYATGSSFAGPFGISLVDGMWEAYDIVTKRDDGTATLEAGKSYTYKVVAIPYVGVRDLNVGTDTKTAGEIPAGGTLASAPSVTLSVNGMARTVNVTKGNGAGIILPKLQGAYTENFAYTVSKSGIDGTPLEPVWMTDSATSKKVDDWILDATNKKGDKGSVWTIAATYSLYDANGNTLTNYFSGGVTGNGTSISYKPLYDMEIVNVDVFNAGSPAASADRPGILWWWIYDDNGPAIVNSTTYPAFVARDNGDPIASGDAYAPVGPLMTFLELNLDRTGTGSNIYGYGNKYNATPSDDAFVFAAPVFDRPNVTTNGTFSGSTWPVLKVDSLYAGINIQFVKGVPSVQYRLQRNTGDGFKDVEWSDLYRKTSTWSNSDNDYSHVAIADADLKTDLAGNFKYDIIYDKGIKANWRGYLNYQLVGKNAAGFEDYLVLDVNPMNLPDYAMTNNINDAAPFNYIDKDLTALTFNVKIVNKEDKDGKKSIEYTITPKWKDYVTQARWATIYTLDGLWDDNDVVNVYYTRSVDSPDTGGYVGTDRKVFKMSDIIDEVPQSFSVSNEPLGNLVMGTDLKVWIMAELVNTTQKDAKGNTYEKKFNNNYNRFMPSGVATYNGQNTFAELSRANN